MNIRATLKRFEDFDKFVEYEERIEVETFCFYKKNYGVEKGIDLWSLDAKLAQEAGRRKTYQLSKMGLVDNLGINFYSPTTYTMDSIYHPDHKFKLGFFFATSTGHDFNFNSIVWPTIGLNVSDMFSVNLIDIIIFDFVKPDWVRSFNNLLSAKFDFQRKAHNTKIDQTQYDLAIKGFDIMAETCDYVLDRPDSDKFRFCWEYYK